MLFDSLQARTINVSWFLMFYGICFMGELFFKGFLGPYGTCVCPSLRLSSPTSFFNYWTLYALLRPQLLTFCKKKGLQQFLFIFIEFSSRYSQKNEISVDRRGLCILRRLFHTARCQLPFEKDKKVGSINMIGEYADKQSLNWSKNIRFCPAQKFSN